jgi:hypothetical protein
MDAAAFGPLLEGLKTGAGEKPSFDFPVPSGFKKLSEAETYVPENLYEKIDGKAPLYIESGFIKLFTQRFVNQGDDNQWFELFVYDMAAVRNAFSVYSVQKRADVEALPAMQFGYRTGNALYFVHGRYYVELVGSLESSSLSGAMAELAEKLAARVDVGEVEKIPELTLFPQENLVPGSAKLYLSNALGFDKLSDTFLCRYEMGEETVSAFLSRRQSPKDARTTAESYYNFLIENGAVVKPTSDATLKTVNGRVLDFYGTTEIIFSTGPFIAGIHEAKNQQPAEKLAARLINRLSEAARMEK